MNLFDRDYLVLNKQEKEIVEKYMSLENAQGIKLENINEKNMLFQNNTILKYYTQLFPNNFLCEDDLKKPNTESILSDFINLISNNETKEQDVLRYIRENSAYFIIGSILRKTNFGHHTRFLFKEFPLGNSFKVDYLLIGKNSHGYHFIFIELESVYGRVTNNDGYFGEVIRKGIDQVKDWRKFLESDFTKLDTTFYNSKHPKQELPQDFIKFDTTKVRYIVIAGRRNYFNDKTRRLAREELMNNQIELIHYDRLIDYSKELLREKEY